MKSRYALALIPLALAACDEKAMQDMKFPWDKPAPVAAPAAPAAPATPVHTPPAVSPLDVPIEVQGGETKKVATAERTTLDTMAYTASGNEPFWRVDVSGTTAVFKTPENQKGSSVTVNRLAYAKGVEYVGELNKSPFALNIRGGDCTDSMSGQKYQMTAMLRANGKTMTGCAGPQETAPKQVAAPAEKPAAKAKS